MKIKSLAPTLLKVTICLLVFSSALLALPLRTINAQATGSKALTIHINTLIRLTDDSTNIQLQLLLQNNSSDKVLSNYSFPNVWQADSLLSVVGLIQGQQQATLTSQQLAISFGNQPIQPGQNKQMIFQLKAVKLEAIGGVRLLNYEAINKFLPDQNILSDNYQINFPATWGKPCYLNLKPELYDIQNQDLYLKDLYSVAVVWGQEQTKEVSYKGEIETGSGLYLANFLRTSQTQKTSLEKFQGLSEIYKDDSGNVYAGIKLQDSPQKYQVSFQVSTKSDVKSTITNPYSAGQKSYYWSVPTKISSQIGQLSKTASDFSQVATIINQVKDIINQNYRINLFNPTDFQISDQGPINPNELNYAEYLTLLSSLLADRNINQQIVLVDQTNFNRGLVFLIEVCQSSECRYYPTSLERDQNSIDQVPMLGLQLISFSGANQLTTNYIHNLSKILPADISYPNLKVETKTDTLQAGQLNLKITLPDSIKTFQKFQVKLDIVNNSTQPLFFDDLLIDNHHFPVQTNDLSGLYQGVLPGQTKTFEINNVYLGRFFLSEKWNSKIPISISYGEITNDQIYTVDQQINLEQNYLFLGVLFLGIISIFVTIYVLILIYKADKYHLKAGFWQLRRVMSNLIWKIKKMKLKKLFTSRKK